MERDRSQIYGFEDLVADPNRFEVRRAGAVVEMEPKALRVLFYLIENRDHVVSKEELINTIWAGTAVTDNALTRVIVQIRKQLGDDARSPRCIETVASTGYRFIANVHCEEHRSTGRVSGLEEILDTDVGGRTRVGGHRHSRVVVDVAAGRQPSTTVPIAANYQFRGCRSRALVFTGWKPDRVQLEPHRTS